MRKLYSFLVLPFLVCFLISCTDRHEANIAKQQLSNHGVNIAYQDTGKGEVTLFFVHGWAINKSYWLNQEKYFAGKYRVVAIDLPGFGESGKNRNDLSVGAYAGDISYVIKQLNLKHVVLVGHSMAGDIVLQAAIENRERVIGIVGVDNFKNYGHPETAEGKKDFANAIDEMRHHFKAVAFQFFNEALFSKTTTPAIKRRILNDVANTDSVAATSCMAQGNDYNEKEMLKQYHRKIYLINSDYRPTDTTGFVKNNIGYDVKYIHATGHFPMVENPQQFNLLLDGIVNGIKK